MLSPFDHKPGQPALRSKWLSMHSIRGKFACSLRRLVPALTAVLFAATPAGAGTFSLNWGTAPFTWTAGATGPVTYTMADQNGFQLSVRLSIARIGGTAISGYPDDLSGTMGTGTSLQLQWDSNAGSSGVGESTNTATLELLNGTTPVPANSLSFRINDIDATDSNNDSANDRCDYVTVTGNAGNPSLSYVQTNASLRSVIIGPGPGSGATGNLAANQAACVYYVGSAVATASNADDNGTIVVSYPAGTSTSTIFYDESIENVFGVTNRDAPLRGIGIWDSTAVTVNNTISLTKTASAASYTAQGQVITYTYVVKNNGPLPFNTTQNIQIQDSRIGTFACGTISAQIASGGTVTCTNTYTVTAADVTTPAGVTNTAIAAIGTSGQAFAQRLQSAQVSVTVANRVIDAVNDTFSGVSINGLSGGSTASVFSNDTLNAAAFANSAVTPSITANGGLTGVTISSAGAIVVPAGTTAGTYTVSYRICETSAPANCDTATATLTVASVPSSGGTSCTGTNLASNGGFESPAQSGVGSFFVSTVPGWSTTDTQIELWTSGFNSVPSHTGNQFAEINANVAGTLTQTTGTVKGGALLDIYWAHRARVGTDVARMTVTDNGGASTNSGNFSATTTAWVVNALRHVTSASASQAQLAFTAVSTGSGAVSAGNFLDTVEVCQTYITLVKSELSRTDTDGSGSDSAGDVITYRYAIANPAGNNRSLSAVSIVDDKLGTLSVSAPASGDTNTNGFLDPGETWIFTVNATLTQANIDAGTLTNIAYATAANGSTSLKSNNSTVTATFTAAPRLALVKTGKLQKKPGNTDLTRAQLGDTILYTYAVTNTGTVTMANIQVTDVHSGSGAPPVPSGETLTDNAPTGDSSDAAANNGVWSALAPKDVVTFSATYTVTQTDVDKQ